MDWVRTYGKGRVYVTMLGHTWTNEENPNFQCKEFQKLIVQGAEWVARAR
jgi:type 1 glutamine amidotransferase